MTIQNESQTNFIKTDIKAIQSQRDSGSKKIKTIKTSESDNSHYAVVPSRGHKKNLILKYCFKYGIMHKEKHVDISSPTN